MVYFDYILVYPLSCRKIKVVSVVVVEIFTRLEISIKAQIDHIFETISILFKPLSIRMEGHPDLGGQSLFLAERRRERQKRNGRKNIV